MAGIVYLDANVLLKRYLAEPGTGAKIGDPELYRIQNPAAHFRMEEDIQATGYIVQEKSWREQAISRPVDSHSAVNSDTRRRI
jgi:hypothetical protein